MLELLRDGFGDVLLTASQARQLRDILGSRTGAGTTAVFEVGMFERAVEPDLEYILCCRVVDWWNLGLSFDDGTGRYGCAPFGTFDIQACMLTSVCVQGKTRRSSVHARQEAAHRTKSIIYACGNGGTLCDSRTTNVRHRTRFLA